MQYKKGGEAGAKPRSYRPILSGVGELDALLGGGLTVGSSTVLIGPAGSAKSTLAMQDLAGASPGRNAAAFLFDERTSTYLARADALDMRASARVAEGTLIVEQIEPGDTSPGQFAYRVKACVEEHAVQVVAIDTLNGYLTAIESEVCTSIRTLCQALESGTGALLLTEEALEDRDLPMLERALDRSRPGRMWRRCSSRAMDGRRSRRAPSGPSTRCAT